MANERGKDLNEDPITGEPGSHPVGTGLGAAGGAAAGAALLMACDLIGRLVRYPFEIPVGTVMGFVGAGIFLFLLYRKPAHG